MSNLKKGGSKHMLLLYMYTYSGFDPAVVSKLLHYFSLYIA